MKLFKRPKCFSEAIALLTTLNCVFGLRVFEYPCGHPRPKLSLIYLLIIYILFYDSHFRVERIYFENIKLMKLEYFLYELVSYIIVVSMLLKMLLGWWYTKKFKVCNKKIFEIDETLRQLGLMVNYDRIYFVTIGTIIIWIILFFMMFITITIYLKTYTAILISLYIVFVQTYSITINSINIFELYIYSRCLQMKFELVNKFLCDSLTNLPMKEIKLGIFEMKDYAKIMNTEQGMHIFSTKTIYQWSRRVQSRMHVSTLKKQEPVISQIEPHFPSQFKEQIQSVQNRLHNSNRRHNSAMTKCQERKYLLQIIKQVHLELCKVSKIVCTILGVQVVWEIGIVTIFLTGTFYYLYVRYFINHEVEGLTEQTFVMLIMCALHIIKVISLNYICKNAADEGNKTIEIIHSIYSCNADTDMQEEIQQFGIQILQSPVIFSAFGLTLDNRVIRMVLKTVSVYLVIMIQVSNALELNNAVDYSY